MPKAAIGRILSHKDLYCHQYPESNFVEVYQLIFSGFTSLAGGVFSLASSSIPVLICFDKCTINVLCLCKLLTKLVYKNSLRSFATFL